MTVKTNAQGKDRKRMVLTIAKWTGNQVKYAGAPTFSYEVGGITIDKDAGIDFGTALPDEAIDRLLQHLCDEGFDVIQFFTSAEAEEEPEPEEEEISGICVSMPRSLFTDKSLENLKAIVAAKEILIKKAFGTDTLEIEITDTKVSFPWLPGVPTPEEIKAFDTFICKLCEMARNQVRVSAKEKPTDNEKYAFRCFLLRLGFIGAEYKEARKILLRNLTGSSAFKSGSPKVQEIIQRIEADADLYDDVMALQDGGNSE